MENVCGSLVGRAWAEAWASDRGLQANPDVKGLPGRFREEYARSVTDYLAQLEKHREATLRALREFKDLPRGKYALEVVLGGGRLKVFDEAPPPPGATERGHRAPHPEPLKTWHAEDPQLQLPKEKK